MYKQAKEHINESIVTIIIVNQFCYTTYITPFYIKCPINMCIQKIRYKIFDSIRLLRYTVLVIFMNNNNV